MAELRTISHSQLMAADTLAIKDLEDAATLHGAFYLDLRGSQISRVFKDVDDCLEAAGTFFSMPLEQKLEHDIDRIGTHRLNGFGSLVRSHFPRLRAETVKRYKPEGRNASVDNSKQDAFEAYYVRSSRVTSTNLH